MQVNKKLAPILIFTYRRVSTLKNCLEDLKLNPLAKHSNLYVFSDGPKSIDDYSDVIAVRNYVSNMSGFKSVTKQFHNKNIGLVNNILSGISKIIECEGKVIVLEDDLRIGKYFLNYMNDALEKYENNKKIFCISGYSYFSSYQNSNLYFIDNQADCLGWGTWKDRWQKISFDDALQIKKLKRQRIVRYPDRDYSYPFTKMLKNNLIEKKSWAINFLISATLDNAGTIYPSRSFVLHDSINSHATNYKIQSGQKDPYRVVLTQYEIDVNKSIALNSSVNELKYRLWLHQFEKYKIVKILRTLGQIFIILEVILEIIGVKKVKHIE